jgi:outer membrane protein
VSIKASVVTFVASLVVAAAVAAGAALSPPDLPTDPEIGDEIPTAAAEPLVELVGPQPGTPVVDLLEAVAMALRSNYQLLGGVDLVRGARLGESAARAQFFPKLTPSFQRALTDTGAVAARTFSLGAQQRVPWSNGTLEATGALRTDPLADPALGRASDLSLSLKQPLLRGFGPTASFREITLARRAREAQERAFVRQEQDLIVRVTASFYQVVRQRQLMTVARQSLDRSENLLRASEARMRAGLASKLDVYRAELSLSYAQTAMISAETELQTGLEDFRVLLGRNPMDAVEPAAVTLSEDEHLQLRLEPLPVLVDRALANRLDLQETHDLVDDARRTASLARQNLLPQLDLTASMTRKGLGPSFGSSLGALGDNRVEMFLSTSYPLERSSDRLSKALADMAVAASQRSFAQRRLEIEAEVRQAVRNLDRIVKNVELQRKGVDLAAQQHRLATLRYQRGIASNFDVVEAEEKLVAARAMLIGLLSDFQVARMGLDRVTGDLDVEAFRQ